MNEFDQFVKHKLRVKNYVRYTDDFIIMAGDKEYLEGILPRIADFLKEKLALILHPKKIIFCKLHQGIDFLGYLIFSHHRLLRTRTRRRMFKKLRKRIKEYNLGKINKLTLEQSLQSYLGVLSHANTYKLSEDFKNRFWFDLLLLN